MRNVQIIDLPKVNDDRGNLSFIEGARHVPFTMRRAYWIYDVPGGEVRGSHAYRRAEEFIVALSGSFDVVLRCADGQEQRVHLCRSYRGVYVPPCTWRTLENFSTNSLGLILSSTPYDEADYIWDLGQLAAPADCPDGTALPDTSAPVPPMRRYALPDCRVLALPRHTELRRGCLTPVEALSEVLPFPLRRVFYIYDIPSGATRGTHAHHRAWQFIVAASSCFDVTLDDGERRCTFRLDRPYNGLLVPPGIWCQLHDFSSAAVALVLTSEPYSREDYICDYNEYLRLRQHP